MCSLLFFLVSNHAFTPLWPIPRKLAPGRACHHLFVSSLSHVPQVSPRPLITPVPLGLPGAPADAAPGGALEEEGMRLALAAAAVAAAADAAEGEGLRWQLAGDCSSRSVQWLI